MIKKDFGAYVIVHYNKENIFVNLERAFLTGNLEEARMKFYDFIEKCNNDEKYELRMKAKYSTREKRFIPCDIYIARSYEKKYKYNFIEERKRIEEARKHKSNEEQIKILFDGKEIKENENENKN